MFVTSSNYKPSDGQACGGPRLVEVGTYISPKLQIESMMLSGMRLEALRQGVYDYDHPSADTGTAIDPTRTRGYDFADAYQAGLELQKKLDQHREERKKISAEQQEIAKLAELQKLKDQVRAELLAENKENKAAK